MNGKRNIKISAGAAVYSGRTVAGDLYFLSVLNTGRYGYAYIPAIDCKCLLVCFIGIRQIDL